MNLPVVACVLLGCILVAGAFVNSKPPETWTGRQGVPFFFGMLAVSIVLGMVLCRWIVPPDFLGKNVLTGEKVGWWYKGIAIGIFVFCGYLGLSALLSFWRERR